MKNFVIRYRVVSANWKKLLVLAGIVATSGCASLPDMNRIQSNMDNMVGYMGVMATNMPAMAYSTQRMADNADEMKRKADGMLKSLELRGQTAEKAVQNYLQAFIDNDRAVVKSLQGIRDELVEIKGSLRPGEPKKVGRVQSDQSNINKDLQARIGQLEERLQALAAQVEPPKGPRRASGPSAERAAGME
ncbi:MAG: hypothetical protein V2B18_05760 [Pseudomonadota bacterium]